MLSAGETEVWSGHWAGNPFLYCSVQPSVVTHGASSCLARWLGQVDQACQGPAGFEVAASSDLTPCPDVDAGIQVRGDPRCGALSHHTGRCEGWPVIALGVSVV